jgi:predicted nucleotidyltransferase
LRGIAERRPDVADLTYLFNHCADWAKRTDEQIGSGGIYIFGSTISRNGDQFDDQQSDIDLVVVFPRTVTTAPARVEWLERLAKAKHELELSLIPVLGRADAVQPMVSVVAATEHEVRADLHKSRAPDFFRGNHFKNLLDLAATPAPLLVGEPAKISDVARQVVQFTQEFRNKYLGSSAAKRVALESW